MARAAHLDLSSLAQAGAEFTVRVTPRAGRNMVQYQDGQIRIQVTALPAEGKANQAVQELLAKALGVAKTRLALIRGESAREKTFRLSPP